MGVNTIDFDNDGDLDLFIGGGTPPYTGASSTSIYYLENDGIGDFANPDSILGNVSARQSIAIGDINQDGTDDIVLVTQSGSTSLTFNLNWYSNISGIDSLGPAILIGSEYETPSSSALEYEMTIIFLTDFDGDGDLDVATKTDWYENLDGLGRFSAAKPYYDFSGNELPIVTQLLDLSGDGIPDIVQPNAYKITQTNNLGLPVTNTTKLLNIREDVETRIHHFDVDLDGDKDVLISDRASIYWFRNTSDSNNPFIDEGLLLDSYNNGDIKNITSADINGDGQIDLIVHSEEYITWCQVEGDGVMSNLFIINVIYTGDATNVLPSDVDLDGDIDIIKFGTGGNSYWIKNVDGVGIFEGDETQISDYLNDPATFGDLDGDGDLDHIYNYSNTSTTTEVHWRENIGGDFPSSTNLFTVNAPGLRYIKHVDLDMDGDKDFFIITANANGSSKEVLYYRNNGAVYEPITWLDASVTPGGYRLMDVNNDYLPDLLIKHPSHDYYKWVPQDSIATFGSVEKLPMTSPIYFSSPLYTYFYDYDEDFDIDMFYFMSSQNGPKIFAMRENLSTQPVIKGMCFFDENQNGIKDSLESGLQNFQTTLDPMSLFSFTDESGFFNYFVDPGTYTLGYQTDSLWALTTDSMTYQISIDTAELAYNYLFGFHPLIDSLSIEPYLTSGPTRCNFEVPFWMNFHNTGTRIASGSVRLVKPSDAEYISADPAPDNINGDTLIWNFTNLYPLNKEEVTLVFKMPDEFSAGNNAHYETRVEVQDNVADSLYQNQHDYNSTILCAIDPNDKLVNPNRLEDFPENYTLFDEKLEYTIRFQNTGNDTAFNVVLTDQLDLNLDWNSLQIIGASHDYETSLDSSGLLTVAFRNILLPDSTTNEILSHGYFSYSIYPIGNLDEMTVIENTANIYFDFNAPIITNTTENNFVSSLDFSLPLLLSIDSIAEVLCADDSIAISFNITGGAGNYEVFLNGNYVMELTPDSTTQYIYSLGIGNYTLMITDSLDHTVSNPFAITGPDPLSTDVINITAEFCDSLGNITLQGIGGVVPYQYIWGDGSTEPQISGEAGIYFLTITDSNGCSFASSYEILYDCLDATDEIEKHGIKIYPNPLYNNEFLIIKTPFKQYELVVFNSMGQRLSTDDVESKEYTVNLHSYTQGVYWLVLVAGDEKYTKKIVKID